MKKLYSQNELLFSLVWVVFYIVTFSIADSISMSVGIRSLLTAPLTLIMVGLLLWWLRRNDLLEKYGLGKFKGDIKQYFFFLPLILITTSNLWSGFAIRFSSVETVLFVISMLCVGFLEEIIFRGFLFIALITKNLNRAIVISSITFGIGHIVNLANGADQFSTFLQILYATAIGYLFTIIFIKGRSLIPGIISHSLLNASSAFSADAANGSTLVFATAIIAIAIGYAIWLEKRIKVPAI